MKTDNEILLAAIDAALVAGDAIADVYALDFTVDFKDDHSPLTTADIRAHQIISEKLAQLYPILSEEGNTVPYTVRSGWARFWMVDPLDGTKEFIKKNGEFTINIALIENGIPVLGVVYAPILERLYFAAEGAGAFRCEENLAVRSDLHKLMASAKSLGDDSLPSNYTIVASRSHLNAETQAFIHARRKQMGEVELISKGSSLKLCLVAEGSAHIYPRLAPTMEWDTAAADAIARAAGCRVYVPATGEPLVYNKENLLNPSFIVSR